MLLSEAMRLGAMLGPQITDHRMLDGYGGSCALGSALLAMGGASTSSRESPSHYHSIAQIFPGLGDGTSDDLFSRIYTKNDTGGFTREQIADWLVESGNDCSSVEAAPAQEIAAALVFAHMVAR